MTRNEDMQSDKVRAIAVCPYLKEHLRKDEFCRDCEKYARVFGDIRKEVATEIIERVMGRGQVIGQESDEQLHIAQELKHRYLVKNDD